jgi:hypothetical protein
MDRLSRPIDVSGTSYTRVQAREPLNVDERNRDTRIPKNRNPRTQQLAAEMRAAHPQDMDYVQAVLKMFTEQTFYYTLSPPKLAGNSVDEFLFDTKRGFCEHYASAFAILMRAAGIPTRVVTGYQGGMLNPYGDYWILRQSDAHAWNEVWIEGRGWVRIDPTAAINPARVEQGLTDQVGADEALADRGSQGVRWFTGARLRLDALRELWRERILDFDPDAQRDLLQKLRIPEPDGQKLVILLAAGMALALFWLTWAVRRELTPQSRDMAARAYQRLCAKLAAAGLPRMQYEGAEAYAARVAELRPDLSGSVTALCRHYSALRYSAPSNAVTLGTFEAAVRSFRPRTRGH